jgi:general secretion pathway protein D
LERCLPHRPRDDQAGAGFFRHFVLSSELRGAHAAWRAGVLAALLLLGACQEQGAQETSAPAPAVTAAPARPPVPLAQPSASDADLARPATPRLYPGTGVFIRSYPAPSQDARQGAAGDITLNFVAADVHEVVRSVLGDLLHLNYAIDPKLQATVTIQTSRPLRRDDLLPTLEQVLRLNGITIVESVGIYRVVPIDEALHSGSVSGPQVPQQIAATAVFGTQIVPLRYVSAAEIQRILQPFVAKGARVEADTTRNLLMVSGGTQDLTAMTDLINTFDVDWLAGLSLGIFPLRTGTAKEVASELDEIFATGSGAPLAGVLKFAPIERINSILVISPQRAYLERARSWIARLDQEDENVARFYEYHVQNSRATDLAKVLSQLLSGGQVQTVEPQTAPGMAPIQMGAPGSGGAGASSGLSQSPLSQSPSTSSQLGSTLSSQAAPGLGTQAAQPPAPAAPDLGATPNASPAGAATDPDLPKARIVADEKNNTLVIFAKPRDYHIVEDAIRKLDVVPLQVLIEATIAEVTLTNDLQFGVEWFFKKGGSQVSFSNLATGAIAPVFPGFNYFFATDNVQVVLNALSSITHVNVVSSPQLLVLDHHVATLQVGDQVPVPVQQAQSTLTPGSPLINTIEFVDTGVILRVSPRVNTNGLITLEIGQQVSQATKTTTSGIDAPTIQQRRVDSTITVQDGETIALGGLIKEDKSKTRNGIPLLSDIPWVGNLFASTDNSVTRTELLILLSPRVIRDSQEARSMTEELRGRLHALEPPGVRVQ